FRIVKIAHSKQRRLQSLAVGALQRAFGNMMPGGRANGFGAARQCLFRLGKMQPLVEHVAEKEHACLSVPALAMSGGSVRGREASGPLRPPVAYRVEK